MAKNNFSLKSITELEAMAKSYGTTIASFLEEGDRPEYLIADISKEEFLNISTFINNAVVKDGSLIEDAESTDSTFFSNILRKYFEESLTVDDIINLKTFVNDFNTDKTDLIYSNIYTYVYGVNSETDGIDYNSIFGRIVTNIKTKIRNLMEITVIGDLTKDSNVITNIDTTALTVDTPIRGTGIPALTTVSGKDAETLTLSKPVTVTATDVSLTLSTLASTHDLTGWFTDTTGVDELYNKMTALEFYDSLFNKSKTIEAMVLIRLINYINNDISPILSSTETPDFSFSDNVANANVVTPTGVLADDTLSGISKVSYSSRIPEGETELEYFRRTENLLKIKSDSGITLLTIPLNVTEAITDSNFGNAGGEIIINVFSVLDDNESYLSIIFSELEGALYEFLTILSPDGTDYFGTTAAREIQNTLYTSYDNTAKLFKNKDLIQDNWFNSNTTDDPKNYANEYENNIAKDGQQLIFIDSKNMILSNLTDLQLNGTTLVDGLVDLFSGIDTTQRLTYTVLYKELNTKLREQCLIDSQEYIVSRLLTHVVDAKETIFQTDKNGISFSSSVDVSYRDYEEHTALFEINDEFYRYKFFYNNIYITRLSNESDLVGYYVGDSSDLSAFTNNYGDLDYEQREIENFINIYQETRNYYYKVLLNKSFIQDTEYKLYERLFISFFSIERFLNAKIDNIHDPDFFNSTDIYNFLESYGLGVLNDEKYDFVIEGKDYKLNIVKLFNELVKLKGSRDVIAILLQAFEVGDLSAEIQKFLILENTKYTNSGIWMKMEILSNFDELTTEYLFGTSLPTIVSGEFVLKNGDIYTLYADGSIVNTPSIKFIEVPYFSDNGSREIYNALNTATEYAEFLADDEYWDSDVVTTDILLDIGLDVSETKYLSLTLSENIYKKYMLSRYMMSTLEYLESNLLKGTTTILYDTKLEAGELFGLTGNISIHSIFEAVKVKYKALMRLYAADGDLINYVDPGTGNYYGINTSINWDFLTQDLVGQLLKDYTHDYTTNLTEFTLAHKATDDSGTGEVTFPKFNIYKESEDWFNFDRRVSTENLDMFYKKYDYTEKTEIAKQLENVIFSTHKTAYGKSDVANKYQNSGVYISELFENLNLLRINKVETNVSEDDLWMYILSKYWNQDYAVEDLSPTYEASGDNLNYKDLYYHVIEDIMQFPIDFFDGLLSPYSSSELNHNEAFQKFSEEIFTNIYQTSKDPIFVDTDDGGTYVAPTDLGTYLNDAIAITNDGTELEGDALQEKILEYTTDILTIIDGLQSLYSSEAYMQWRLSLKDQEEATLSFVQTAVEIFLSYTTELYYTTFKKKYDSQSEIVPIAEKIVHRLEAHKMDMIFYDDKLNIETLTEGDE